MEAKVLIEKLETDLSGFLISEIPRARLEQSVVDRQIYLYKGLNIYLTSKARAAEKTIAVRIGALEAQFSLVSMKRISGSLMTDDEHNVRIWLNKPEIIDAFKKLFDRDDLKYANIMPFDLECLYDR